MWLYEGEFFIFLFLPKILKSKEILYIDCAGYETGEYMKLHRAYLIK